MPSRLRCLSGRAVGSAPASPEKCRRRAVQPQRNTTPTLCRDFQELRVRKFRTTPRQAPAARCRVSAANSFPAPPRTRKLCSSALASWASQQKREAATQVPAHLLAQPWVAPLVRDALALAPFALARACALLVSVRIRVPEVSVRPVGRGFLTLM